MVPTESENRGDFKDFRIPPDRKCWLKLIIIHNILNCLIRSLKLIFTKRWKLSGALLPKNKKDFIAVIILAAPLSDQKIESGTPHEKILVTALNTLSSAFWTKLPCVSSWKNAVFRCSQEWVEEKVYSVLCQTNYPVSYQVHVSRVRMIFATPA